MKREDNISNISKDKGGNHSLAISKEEVSSRKFLLKEKTIGISISESDNLCQLGYGVTHLKDVMIEVAKYLLSLGGKLAYGGDMRTGGFTKLMFDLLLHYNADAKLHPNERFFNYLAWPISLNLSIEERAKLKHNVTFKLVNPPSDLNINKDVFLPPDSPDNLYIWSQCLTKMREDMALDCDARIFIGGRSKEFKGKCPGVLEELLISLEKKQPIYLVGAFGGITKDATDILDGIKRASFTNEYHLKNKQYEEFFKLYHSIQSTDIIDYAIYFDVIRKVGFEGLSRFNGLSITDNRRLSVTPHINEIIFLIIKGLTNVFKY